MNGLGEYGQAAVSIIAHGGSTGSHGLYWTEGQILHCLDHVFSNGVVSIG